MQVFALKLIYRQTEKNIIIFDSVSPRCRTFKAGSIFSIEKLSKPPGDVSYRKW